jgi:alpha-glucosidase
MQWRPGPGAGFTTGTPWLRLAADAETRNVECQAGDPDSVLATYRRVLAFRRTSAALRRGSMTRLDSGDPDVLAWRRGSGDDELLVLVSFVGEPRRIALGGIAGSGNGGWTPRVGTHRVPAAAGPDGTIALRPDEAVVLGRSRP